MNRKGMRNRSGTPNPRSAEALERLRRRLAGADQGWFFAQIADQVAQRRAELGLSQQQLAQLVGTTQSAIARLERGGRPPRIDTLLRISESLDCELHVELRPRPLSDSNPPEDLRGPFQG